MTRAKVTMLFAVTIASPSAMADPAPAQKPRVLQSGAPACGNVMSKGTAPRPCEKPAPVQTILTGISQSGWFVRVQGRY